MMYLAGRVMTKPARRSRAALDAWSLLLVIVVLAALVPLVSPFGPLAALIPLGFVLWRRNLL